MSSSLSIAQMQAQLEARAAHHRDQEALHAQQEVFHREQKALHAAELQTAIERLESFQAAASAAGEFVGRQSAAAPAGGSDDGFVPVEVIPDFELTYYLPFQVGGGQVPGACSP